MSENNNPFSMVDPFMKFWSDLAGRMTAAGMPTQQPPADVLTQIRRAFFDAMAEQADQFLRSEMFLNALKQSMDISLAWQQTMNQTLQRGLSAAQMPTRNDVDHMVVLVRGMEERLMERLDDVTRRVERMESTVGGSRSAAKS